MNTNTGEGVSAIPADCREEWREYVRTVYLHARTSKVTQGVPSQALEAMRDILYAAASPSPQPAAAGGEMLSKIDKALTVVSELCDGARDWVMSVPARPDEDPDLVISDALRSARAALAARPADQGEGAGGVPPEVMAALDRMSTPLHESWLKGATAEADARCMKVIRDYVLATSPKPTGEAGVGAVAEGVDSEPWVNVRGCGWLHYTPKNIDAMIRDLKAIERGAEFPAWIDRDHRTRCGHLWRVISALSHEIPLNPDPVIADDATTPSPAAGVALEALTDDAELLDWLEKRRCALVPLESGGWDAERFDDDGVSHLVATRRTLREAIRAAIEALETPK